MDNKKLTPASDFCNELVSGCMKDMNWHQKLKFSMQLKFDDIWFKILKNTIYKKYKD